MPQDSAEKMSDVGLLKELLFDDESRALDELARRIEELATSEPERRSELEAKLRAEIAHEIAELNAAQDARQLETLRRLELVFEQAGTVERFQASVAQVLDGALRKAEVERHAELSEAMAPLVVRTIKNEIHNSQDELVEALYPITGRMVKAYVASAMKDLVNEINRKLESNPLMLRVRSLATGRSVAELALAESQSLELEELLLIRRGSGELLARWPERGGTRDHVMGGILSAINSFAIEALGDDGTALREIDLGDERVYLRASPVFLLAAKCRGSAPDSIEQIIDDEFLATIEARHRESDTAAEHGRDDEVSAELLNRLAERLERRISDKQAELDGMPLGIKPVKVLGWTLGFLLVGWLAWSQLDAYESRRVGAIASEMIEATPEITGYPTSAVVGPRGRELTLTGLAPTDAARDALLMRLERALPSVRIIDQIAIVPNSAAAIEPEIARVRRDLTGLETELAQRMVRRATERASVRVNAVLPDLRRLAAAFGDDEDTSRVRDITARVEQAGRELATMQSVIALPEGSGVGLEVLARLVHKVTATLSAAADQVSELLMPGGGPAKPAAGAPVSDPSSMIEGTEAMASEAERLAAVTVALVQAQAAIKRLPQPAPVVIKAEPTARARLEDFTRSHAVFFADDTVYRDEAAAAGALDELARLMRQTGDVVRVVGYTDDRGGQSRNSSLSLSRAEKVRDELIARGIDAHRLVAVGRLDRLDLSPLTGTGSPNRRVQFEIGFVGEARE